MLINAHRSFSLLKFFAFLMIGCCALLHSFEAIKISNKKHCIRLRPSNYSKFSSAYLQIIFRNLFIVHFDKSENFLIFWPQSIHVEITNCKLTNRLLAAFWRRQRCHEVIDVHIPSTVIKPCLNTFSFQQIFWLENGHK